MNKRKMRVYRSNKCLNCETELDKSEQYCHYCGQLNSTKKLTIRDFFEEFFSNFYAYDSRLRNSFISLFTKPGNLAKEFNEGKRQKYANPFRLFLSVSIVLFILIDYTNKYTDFQQQENSQTIKKDSLEQVKMDSLNLLLMNTSLRETQNPKKNKLDKDSIYNGYKKSKYGNNIVNRIYKFKDFHDKNPNKSVESSITELGYENNMLNKLLFSKAKTFKTNDIDTEITDYLSQKLPLLLFLTLPILTLLFWLILYSKSKNYTEHLIFTYSFYTFIFISIIIIVFFNYIYENLSFYIGTTLFLVVFPIYLYKSLRNFYQLSHWKTTYKFILLNILFFPTALLCFIIVISLGMIFF